MANAYCRGGDCPVAIHIGCIIPIIFEFDAQCLCNLAHASAIAGHVVVIVIVIVIIVVVVVDFDSLLKAWVTAGLQTIPLCSG
jgi:hypothetical protein